MASFRDIAKLDCLRSLEEPIELAQRVTYLSKRGERTELAFVLTRLRGVLIKNGKIMREICLEEIEAITLSETSAEIVVHIRQDADERFSAHEKRDEIVSLMLDFKIALEKSLVPVFFVRDLNLNRFVTSEEEIEEGVVLRPEESLKSMLDSASFRELVRQKEARKQELALSTLKIFPADQRKVSIADFELLHTLGKGAHGKVVLCEKKDEKGTFYAMKILKKRMIIEKKQLENTKTERWILANANHPSLVSLKYVFQNDSNLYFVMEFMQGGDLFHHLRRNGRFSEPQVKFISACIVLGLGHLHKHDYIYRDLKPENILLTGSGYAKLADFGLAKYIKKTELTNSFCGTKEYLSPEVIQMKGYNRPTDWWALGTLVYELLYGMPPFFNSDCQKMYHNIVNNPVKFKSTPVSDEAKSFISALLQKDPALRLGTQADSLEVMSHPWLNSISWFSLINQTLEPAYQPCQLSASWLQNFDQSSLRQKPTDSVCIVDPYMQEQLRRDFQDFEDTDIQVQTNDQLTSSEVRSPKEFLSPVPSNSSISLARKPQEPSGPDLAPLGIAEYSSERDCFDHQNFSLHLSNGANHNHCDEKRVKKHLGIGVDQERKSFGNILDKDEP